MSGERPAPIMARCAASGSTSPHGICTYCGSPWVVQPDGSIVEHETQDIIAMIERGDFDAR